MGRVSSQVPPISSHKKHQRARSSARGIAMADESRTGSLIVHAIITRLTKIHVPRYISFTSHTRNQAYNYQTLFHKHLELLYVISNNKKGLKMSKLLRQGLDANK